jgi:hypothetical protein
MPYPIATVREIHQFGVSGRRADVAGHVRVEFVQLTSSRFGGATALLTQAYESRSSLPGASAPGLRLMGEVERLARHRQDRYAPSTRPRGRAVRD